MTPPQLRDVLTKMWPLARRAAYGFDFLGLEVTDTDDLLITVRRSATKRAALLEFGRNHLELSNGDLARWADDQVVALARNL